MNRPALTLILLVASATAALSAVEGRHAVQGDPRAGGTAIHAVDRDTPGVHPRRPRLDHGAGRAAGGGSGEAGGDDVLIDRAAQLSDVSMDDAQNGDLYVVVSRSEVASPAYLDIWRSQNGGDTWSLWHTLGDGVSSLRHPKLVIPEGGASNLHLAYVRFFAGTGSVEMITSPLGGAASFGAPQVIYVASGHFPDNIDVITDAATFASYFLYLAFDVDDGDGHDIWFARSTDQGSSWETAYEVATVGVGLRGYEFPDLSYGFDGWLMLAYTFRDPDETLDRAIRFRRAENYASGGLASWQSPVLLTPNNNGNSETSAQVAAPTTTTDAVLLYVLDESPGVPSTDSIMATTSTNSGLTWSTPTTIGNDGSVPEELFFRPALSDFLAVSGTFHRWRRAPLSDLSNWPVQGYFTGTPEDDNIETSAFANGACVVEARGNQLAKAWSKFFSNPEEDELFFDAEWRGGEGYPDTKPGFPVVLPAGPANEPMMVDLDGNGTLEICFQTADGAIHAVQPDGTELPGFPVTTGLSPVDGPLAAGDLNGDGRMLLVMGASDGQVYAWTPDGQEAFGFPEPVSTGDIYVSIGALGGPYPRVVVAAAEDRTTFLSYRGEEVPGSVARNWLGSSGRERGAAIGDVDGDGVAEVVQAFGTALIIFEMSTPGIEHFSSRGHPAADRVTLADLDGGPAAEIGWPGEDGFVELIDGNGNYFESGWPWFTDNLSNVRSITFAEMRAGGIPEIVVSEEHYKLYVVDIDGTPLVGYPVTPSPGWFLRSAPVVGGVVGSVSDVIVGSRDENGYAYETSGARLGGWPRPLDDRCNLTPVLGDIDGDGLNEVAFLTQSSLEVFELNHPPQSDPLSRWPMYGHDPQRTGCLDCVEDVVTAAPSAEVASAVALRPPFPNPAAAHTLLSFAVPARVAVELAVFDLRGRRIRTIRRSEVSAGIHQVAWDLRDRRGRSVGNGSYLARLNVRGPGLEVERFQRLTVVR